MPTPTFSETLKVGKVDQSLGAGITIIGANIFSDSYAPGDETNLDLEKLKKELAGSTHGIEIVPTESFEDTHVLENFLKERKKEAAHSPK